MTKEVKIPMIVGVMLYGIVLMIDLFHLIISGHPDLTRLRSSAPSLSYTVETETQRRRSE